MTTRNLLHFVADYPGDDLATTEVIAALRAQMPPGYQIWPTRVPSFSTVACGFIVAQLGLADPPFRPEETIIFANCAPRRDLAVARHDNEGEELVYAHLTNGVPVIAVNSGYSLSFVREEIDKLFSLHVERKGSQFRSRDFFPQAVAAVADGTIDSLKEHELDPQQAIALVPPGLIAYIDSFGNIKSTYREGDAELSGLNAGDKLEIQIGAQQVSVMVSKGNFNVAEGEFAFGPGSSGFGRRFWEIFLRGGSASKSFKHPLPGAEIKILGR